MWKTSASLTLLIATFDIDYKLGTDLRYSLVPRKMVGIILGFAKPMSPWRRSLFVSTNDNIVWESSETDQRQRDFYQPFLFGESSSKIMTSPQHPTIGMQKE